MSQEGGDGSGGGVGGGGDGAGGEAGGAGDGGDRAWGGTSILSCVWPVIVE